MKKIATFAIIVLIINIFILGFYIHLSSTKSTPVNTTIDDLALKESILNDSSWLYLNTEDFYGYLNGTYTTNIQTLISSLEEAIPVIIHTSNDKFIGNEDMTFIVASAFDTTNRVYTYYKNPETNKFIKKLVSLETLLEDANAILIYNKKEEI